MKKETQWFCGITDVHLIEPHIESLMQLCTNSGWRERYWRIAKPHSAPVTRWTEFSEDHR